MFSVHRGSGWLCSDCHEWCHHYPTGQPEADPRTDFVWGGILSVGYVKLQPQPDIGNFKLQQWTQTTAAEQPEWWNTNTHTHKDTYRETYTQLLVMPILYLLSSEILRGGVKITHNPLLCNIETIQWWDIVDNTSNPKIIFKMDFFPRTCMKAMMSYSDE